MALVLKDRVKETTTTTGTGTVTLAGAAAGFQSFSVIGNTNTTYYCIADQGSPNEWEVGIGTYSSSGTTLARTTVLSNSSGTEPSAISFAAGTKDVFVVYPAGKSVNLDASGNATALGTVAATTTLTSAVGLPIATGVSGLGTGIATALAINTGSAGAPVLFNGALGTPSSGTATNLTGTASININGTVGATTPTTVVATQVDVTAQGDLRLQDTTGGEYVALQAPGTLAASYTLTLPTDDGTASQVLTTDGNGVLSWTTGAAGDVVGPATATDNAITRFDLTTGKLVQNSLVTVADDGAIVAPQVGSVIPFYFANQAAFPSASTYHGALAHSHADAAMYFAHGGVWTRILNDSGPLGTPSSGTVTNLTGTASININGTVGATTPAVGTFTVLTGSSVVASNGLFVNNTTVAANYTIASGFNAMSVGPVTISSGISVTISSGQRWLVL